MATYLQPVFPTESLSHPRVSIVNPLTSNRTNNFFRRKRDRSGANRGTLDAWRSDSHSEGVTTTCLESSRTVLSYQFTSEKANYWRPKRDPSLARATRPVPMRAEHSARVTVIPCERFLLAEWTVPTRTRIVSGGADRDGAGAILATVTAPSFLVTE